jgi:hypothetical protein
MHVEFVKDFKVLAGKSDRRRKSRKQDNNEWSLKK